MVETPDTLELRDLFGGAIKLGIPPRLVDVSDFRPVPDHQEVFTDALRDQSLIVEVMEFQDIPDEDAGAFFFTDLAKENGATSFELQAVQSVAHSNIPLLPAGIFVSVAAGQQIVVKNHQTHAVQVLVANIRIPQHKSDVLLVLNTPEGAQSGASADLFQQILATLRILDWGLFGA